MVYFPISACPLLLAHTSSPWRYISAVRLHRAYWVLRLDLITHHTFQTNNNNNPCWSIDSSHITRSLFPTQIPKILIISMLVALCMEKKKNSAQVAWRCTANVSVSVSVSTSVRPAPVTGGVYTLNKGLNIVWQDGDSVQGPALAWRVARVSHSHTI